MLQLAAAGDVLALVLLVGQGGTKCRLTESTGTWACWWRRGSSGRLAESEQGANGQLKRHTLKLSGTSGLGRTTAKQPYMVDAVGRASRYACILLVACDRKRDGQGCHLGQPARAAGIGEVTAQTQLQI